MNLLVGVALRKGTARLAEAGCESPALDARLLLAEAMRLPVDALVGGARQPLGDEELVRFHALLERRLAGEPVARILGRREFWSLDLSLSPETLVPRPETETVVETALKFLRARSMTEPAVLDLGTGTGAILLAIVSELPRAFGVGVDRSFGAARTARKNALRLGLGERAAFLCADFAEAIVGQFDLVVSNPPYVATDEIGRLDREVRDFDPALALDGGPDGLAAYRRIAAVLPRLLTAAGFAVLELGAGQEEAVAAIFAGAGLAPRPPRHDLAGIARALVVERPV